MDCRTLDVTIVSAEGLKKVSRFGKMQTYAIAWVDPYYRLSTHVNKDGGTKPAWHQKLSFSLPEYFFQQPNSRLTAEIYSRGSMLGNRFVGGAIIPFSDFLQQSNQEQILTYPLKRRSGKVKGSLRLSVRVGDMAMAAGSGSAPSSSEPVTAYPAGDDYKQQPEQRYYPPPPQQYGNYAGYPPPPYPQGYGGPAYYPPPPVQQPQYVQPPRRTGMGGMGLGTGLLAGALGGLILGEVIDDVGFGGGGFGGGGFDGGFGGGGFDGGFGGGGFDGGFF